MRLRTRTRRRSRRTSLLLRRTPAAAEEVGAEGGRNTNRRDASRSHASYPHPVPKKPRARTERRAQERAQEKLARDRAKLALLEPGGAPERPLVVESASQVEVHARSLPCTRCESDVRVESHEARTVGDARLRLARLLCPRCGTRRDVWFRLAPPLPS